MGTFAISRPIEETLNYNAMQLSVQRRLHRGLQMGLAYTLSKSEGIQGYDWVDRRAVRPSRAFAIGTMGRRR